MGGMLDSAESTFLGCPIGGASEINSFFVESTSESDRDTPKKTIISTANKSSINSGKRRKRSPTSFIKALMICICGNYAI